MIKQKLNRVINRVGIIAIAINGLIGAGIFALPAGAAALTGQFSPWMFVICGLMMGVVILCFAQLSTGFEDNGGPVLYAQKAYGNHIAFQTTWLLYVGRVTALAANSNACVFYLSVFFPVFNEGFWHYFSLVSLISLLALLNMFGVRRAIKVLNLITFVKLLPLLILVAFGLTEIDPSQLFTIDIDEISDFQAALLLIVYAYIGFEGALIPAGESKSPTKNIKYSLLITLCFTIVLYFFIQAISFSALPDLANSTRPIADVAGNIFGDYGSLLISIAAIISITGNLSSVMFAAPRMTYALACVGNLPKWFAKTSAKTQSPNNSILFLLILALILAVSGSFIWLAMISSLARLIGYFISIAALIKMKDEYIEKQRWFLPFQSSLPLLALLICAWMAMQASLASWGLTLLFIICGSLLYRIAKHKTARES